MFPALALNSNLNLDSKRPSNSFPGKDSLGRFHSSLYVGAAFARNAREI